MGEYNDFDVAQLEEELKTAKLQNTQMANNSTQSSIYSQQDMNNLIQWQLDLSEEKEKIDHLLRGHVIKVHPNGKEEWIEPKDLRLKPLSDYGVEQLMNIINFYLSRNNILSFYTKDEVQQKMLDIGEELADKVYNEYEYFFYKPSVFELMRRDFEKIKELREKYEEDEETINYLSKKLAIKYKKEIEEIRIKNLKNFPMIHQLVLNQIHASYNRALQGEERQSLRKFMHINLSEGTARPQQNLANTPQRTRTNIFKPSTWNS